MQTTLTHIYLEAFLKVPSGRTSVRFPVSGDKHFGLLSDDPACQLADISWCLHTVVFTVKSRKTNGKRKNVSTDTNRVSKSYSIEIKN